MNTVVIIFIVLLVVMTAFTAGVIIDELVRDRKESTATVPETAEPEPVVEVVDTETVATQASATVSVGSAPTHEEKYNALPDDVRRWYDEIAAYAAAVDRAKHVLTKRYEEYALGSRKIVRLTIKRGVIVCGFILRNSDFYTYTSENKIAVSTAPTTMKINDETLVSAAKNTIDLVVRSIGEEKALNRRLASERRKKKNAQNDQNNDERGIVE